MIQETPQAERFKQQLRDSLRQETQNSRAIKIAKQDHAYTCGDPAEMVYFIESGQIKLLMISPEGKECLLAIHTAGDIFGELCLSGLGSRLETATAMEETNLKQIPCSSFFARLRRDLLFEGFVQYLAVRIADQQQVIANLVTVDSEQRLGKTLLQLARKLGKQDPRSIRIEQKISHEELSEMVGTTRPRISKFMQRFRILGLIETSAERFLIIKEKKLTDYLAQIIKSKLKLVQNIGALDPENAGKYLNLEADYARAQQAGIRLPSASPLLPAESGSPFNAFNAAANKTATAYVPT